MIKTISARGIDVEVKILDPEEHIQKYWMQGNFYETQKNGLLNHIYTNEKRKGYYIDIGACIGNHALFFAEVMEARFVQAVEPHPDNYEHLRTNLGMNTPEINWGAWNIALGEKAGKCSMKPCGKNSVGMMQVQEGEGEIPIKRIDDLHWFDGYDVIKIDVEHYNAQLLAGAKETFTKGTGNIYIEAESEKERDEVDWFMSQYGYKRVEGLNFNHTPTYKYVKV